MPQLLPGLRSLTTRSGGVTDRAVATALRNVEDHVNDMVRRLSSLRSNDTGGVATLPISMTDVLGLTAALAAINSALAGKSNVGHGHAISDVSGLQAALDGKIDEVIAGTNLSGGGTSGTVTLSVVDSPVFAGSVTISPTTEGSVLFAGTGGLVSENNSDLNWSDSTSALRIGPNTLSAGYALSVSKSNAGAVMGIRNTSASGHAAISTFTSGGTFIGSFGYGNASVAEVSQRNSWFLRTEGVDFQLDSGGNGTTRHLFGMTANAAYQQFSAGQSAAVSAASTGRLRYNATTQAFQVSHNGAAYTPVVVGTRTISTTAPLAGGGDLSADRTLSLSDNGITNAKLRDSAALSVIGRSANSVGDPADIVAGTDGHVLRRSGTTLDFGLVAPASVSPGTNGHVLTTVAGVASWAAPASGVGGSGTVGALAKFTAASTVGDSLVSESGSTVAVAGALHASGALSTDGNATLGNTALDSHVVNGALSLQSVPTAGALRVGSVQTRLYFGRQIFTSSGTYTPTTGTRAVLVRMVGGGGGGGGGNNGGNSAVGGGGASGEYLEKWISAGGLVTGGTVTIGAGGTGGNQVAGGTGGDTSVVVNGTTWTARGGGGGGRITFGGGGLALTAGGSGQASTSTGDINYQQDGGHGLMGTTNPRHGGYGGSNPLGSGGGQQYSAGGGLAPRGRGGGGGGAFDLNATNQQGAAGSAGIVIIEEYA